MRDGKVVERGSARQVFDQPQTPYTQALIAAAFNLEAIGADKKRRRDLKRKTGRGTNGGRHRLYQPRHRRRALEEGPGSGPRSRSTFARLDSLGDKADIEVALAWKPDAGLLASFPNLKLIVSLGMGVDHLLADDKLPAGVPIMRIMDDGLVGQMSEYALYWALRHHRDIDKYAASQRAKQWKVERLRRHHPSPHRHPGAGHDRPGHGQEIRRAGLSHGGLEPHGQERCPASRRSMARTASSRSWRAATSW